MAKEASAEVAKVLESGFIGQGPKVDEFEQKLQNYLGVQNVVTTNSATSAEHLIFRMIADRVSRREVLTTALTCTASNWPPVHEGFSLKWVDIDPTTLNMDLDDLERKITRDTAVIYLVHWGGYPNDLDKVSEIVEKTYNKFGFRPFVVEDCAHAFGSKYKGKFIGTHGNLCTFSFQAIKHITSVDGGALVFNGYDQMNKDARLLRWYGIDRDDKGRTDFRCEMPIDLMGYKYHMNDVSATVGMANLACADKIIQRHKDNAAFYDRELSDLQGITTLNRFPGFDSSFWIYSLLVEDKLDFSKAMRDRGIATSQVHERNDIHPCVSQFKAHLPNLDKVTPRLSAIPVGWWVTDEDRQHIVDSIKKGW